MNRKRKEKGITLIALVITIIVLLILAGVSIATLTGENGILTKSNTAKTKTIMEEEKEQIKLAYNTVIANKLEKEDKTAVTASELEKELKELNSSVTVITEGDNLKIVFGESESSYILDSNGNITILSDLEETEDSQIIAEIINNPEAYYGKIVTNYKASDSDTNIYRIFYVDKNNDFGDGVNTIYLKADYNTRSEIIKLDNYASYDATNTKVREMNPDWSNGKTSDSDSTIRGNAENMWNINEKVAAYLCSPVNEITYDNTALEWKEYYNSKYANYVIGGPSIEMYIKSYNQAYQGISDIQVYTLGAFYKTTTTHGYVYTLNGAQSNVSNNDNWTGKRTVDYTKFGSMYCGYKGSSEGFWVLASPHSVMEKSICQVANTTENSGFLNSVDGSMGVKLCPVIAVKPSFVPEISTY